MVAIVISAGFNPLIVAVPDIRVTSKTAPRKQENIRLRRICLTKLNKDFLKLRINCLSLNITQGKGPGFLASRWHPTSTTLPSHHFSISAVWSP